MKTKVYVIGGDGLCKACSEGLFCPDGGGVEIIETSADQIGDINTEDANILVVEKCGDTVAISGNHIKHVAQHSSETFLYVLNEMVAINSMLGHNRAADAMLQETLAY
jgi:hypothetical protein